MAPVPLRVCAAVAVGARSRWTQLGFLLFSVLAILGVLIWQAIAASGVADPTVQGLSRPAIILSSGVLVFREGLEAVLVLAAVTAGLARQRERIWNYILAGVAAALAATIATWFIAIAVISSVSASELHIQAVTGLIAIAVLLVVMNWFFHKLYWTGWICHHCKRKQRLMSSTATTAGVAVGLALLGFTAIYREGFEVVLFLQNLRLEAGAATVLNGAGIGLALTALIAVLTFAAHRRLPYKKMLVYTGILLAGVLFVMVGESAQELQLAGWLPTHELPIPIPAWMGTWFATFPNVEGLVSQALAGLLVLGSYLWVRRSVPKTSAGQPVTAECDV